jgi:hypothetical protein
VGRAPPQPGSTWRQLVFPDTPAAEKASELLHEIMFKLGMLRSVIVHRAVAAQGVHAHWLDVQSARSPHCRTFKGIIALCLSLRRHHLGKVWRYCGGVTPSASTAAI